MNAPHPAAVDPAPDYFTVRNGQRFAGLHLLVDLWGAPRLDDSAHLRQCLRDAAQAAGATLLHEHFHVFTPHGGVTGVLLLAESHISIHTWPEHGFAAVDVFMCGSARPERAVQVIEAGLCPASVSCRDMPRGQPPRSV